MTFTLNPDTTAPVLFTSVSSLTTLGLVDQVIFTGASTNWSQHVPMQDINGSIKRKRDASIVSDGVENAFISNAINAESVNEAYLGVYQTSDGQPWIDVNEIAQSYLPWRSNLAFVGPKMELCFGMMLQAQVLMNNMYGVMRMKMTTIIML